MSGRLDAPLDTTALQAARHSACPRGFAARLGLVDDQADVGGARPELSAATARSHPAGAGATGYSPRAVERLHLVQGERVRAAGGHARLRRESRSRQRLSVRDRGRLGSAATQGRSTFRHLSHCRATSPPPRIVSLNVMTAERCTRHVHSARGGGEGVRRARSRPGRCAVLRHRGGPGGVEVGAIRGGRSRGLPQCGAGGALRGGDPGGAGGAVRTGGRCARGGGSRRRGAGGAAGGAGGAIGDARRWRAGAGLDAGQRPGRRGHGRALRRGARGEPPGAGRRDGGA
jgi:hypothetical protein